MQFENYSLFIDFILNYSIVKIVCLLIILSSNFNFFVEIFSLFCIMLSGESNIFSSLFSRSSLTKMLL